MLCEVVNTQRLSFSTTSARGPQRPDSGVRFILTGKEEEIQPERRALLKCCECALRLKNISSSLKMSQSFHNTVKNRSKIDNTSTLFVRDLGCKENERSVCG